MNEEFDNEKFDELLDIVRNLESKYKDKDVFNVFHSIGFRSQEVMHSKFIATMLDPRGSHGMGSGNLKLFFDKIGLFEFSPDSAKVEIEQRAGNRWIDIKISIGNNVVIIENKVWAKDQDRQLIDYYQSCAQQNNRVKVIYLTLDGKRPTSNSLGDDPYLTQNVICISYEKEIIPWIDDCAKKAVGRVKASLEMYSELVSDLINKNKYMNDIFEELRKDKTKLRLAVEINSALQGRNYFIEFPEIKETLFDVVLNDIDEINPYPEDSNLSIEFPEKPEIGVWTITFDVENAYIKDYNDDDDESKIHYIDLFHYYDITNKLLQSLITEDRDIAGQILSEKFEEIRRISKA